MPEIILPTRTTQLDTNTKVTDTQTKITDTQTKVNNLITKVDNNIFKGPIQWVDITKSVGSNVTLEYLNIVGKGILIYAKQHSPGVQGSSSMNMYLDTDSISNMFTIQLTSNGKVEWIPFQNTLKIKISNGTGAAANIGLKAAYILL